MRMVVGAASRWNDLRDASRRIRRFRWSKVMAKFCMGHAPKLASGKAGLISTEGWLKE